MTTYLEEDIEYALSLLTVFPDKVPDDNSADYPCVVYQDVDGIPLRTHSSIYSTRYRYRFSCWGKSKEDSLALAETVKQRLDLNNTNFTMAVLINVSSAVEVEPSMYRKVLEFFIWSDK